MKSLSLKNQVAVDILPTPTTDLKGCIVRLTTNDHPYWCNGAAWIDLSAAASGQNVAISPTSPGYGVGNPGLWIQTGLGTSGEDFTMWIEDGL